MTEVSSRVFKLSVLAVSLAGLSMPGCGGDGTALATGDGGQLIFGDPGLTTPNPAIGKSGQVVVALQSDPSPAVRGLAVFRYQVNDTSGKPLDGLNLSVLPWMPQMNHGTSLQPVVNPLGGGLYEVSNVYLFMPGEFELRTTISGPVADTVTPTLTVH